MGNATDFLKLALAPELPNRTTASPIRPTVIREGELLGMDLSRFDCVFICNVALFTDRVFGAPELVRYSLMVAPSALLLLGAALVTMGFKGLREFRA